MVKTVSGQIEEYMENRPMLLSHAADGIINISSLARKIRDELKIKKSQDAVMVSLYRYIEKAKRAYVDREKVHEILENTDTNIHSNYAVAVVNQKTDIEAEAIISFGKMTVGISPAGELTEYRNKSRFYKEDLVLLELKHNQNIEDTPGVLFHILSRFYEKQISITEIFSAWDSTYILIEKKDMKKIMEMLFS